ncbi:hypothetical protein Tco_0921213 [Tanacetum coccineum]
MIKAVPQQRAVTPLVSLIKPPALSSSFSSDFEIVSIKPSSYTSLRDILPSPKSVVQSPKTPCYVAHSRYEILIRNRLVKEAAWAYLQPMSTSPEADGSSVLHRLWTQISGAFVLVASVAFDCLLLCELERDTCLKLRDQVFWSLTCFMYHKK